MYYWFVFLLSLLIILIGLSKYYHHVKSMSFAKQFVELTQYEVSSEDFLQTVEQHFTRIEMGHYCTEYLSAVRDRFGVIRDGHIMFLMMLADQNYPDLSEVDIPSFDQKQ
ncbi:hypothetical protein JCM19233_111 [Vibrio astriarenae]|nr:hypothetical protein JCM19233_111 [Vibrio sp. C7]